jgi:probable F420-dependent oxidoreductase
MEIGFALPVSGSWATPDNVIEIAELAEALGYSSLWTFQRLLSPVTPDGDQWLPPAYHSVLDPFAVLAFVAARTSRVRLGVAVINAPFSPPVMLAKAAATIDVLSGGRLDLGLGSGWMPDEFAATGAGLDRRGAQMDEYIAALEACWSPGVTDFDGEFSVLPRSVIAPGPQQTPRPPILLGGAAPAALRRAGRSADGWVSASTADLSKLGDSIETVRTGAREAGRDPAQLRFVCRGVAKVRDDERGPLTGSVEDIRSDLAAIKLQGMTETFIDLNFDPQIGSPTADPERSMDRARELLQALAR